MRSNAKRQCDHATERYRARPPAPAAAEGRGRGLSGAPRGRGAAGQAIRHGGPHLHHRLHAGPPPPPPDPSHAHRPPRLTPGGDVLGRRWWSAWRPSGMPA
jgi:hypothetical protein